MANLFRRLFGKHSEPSAPKKKSVVPRDHTVLGEHKNEVYAVAFSPDSQQLASSSHDGAIILWNVTGGEKLAVLERQSFVVAVAFSPDGTRLASSSKTDHTARVWDLSSGKADKTLKHDHKTVNSVAWSPDGMHLATTNKYAIQVWDLGKGEVIAILEDEQMYWVNSVEWSPDGACLVAGSGFGDTSPTVCVWDVANEKLLTAMTGHKKMVREVVWSPDGTRIASVGSDSAARIWNVDNGEELAVLELPMLADSVAWSPDGTCLVTGGYDSIARVWDVSGKKIRKFLRHKESVRAVAWSPDGSHIATGGGDEGDYAVRIWKAP